MAEETDTQEKEIPEHLESLTEPERALVQQGYPEVATWQDVIEAGKDTKTGFVAWEGKQFPYKYKMIGWGVYNQITEELAEEMGTDINKIVYERTKQEKLIKQMVIEFCGVPLQKNGEILHEKWLQIPAPLGEQLRVTFFQNTGEMLDLLGLNKASVKQLKGIIDDLFDKEGKLLKDGKVVEKEKALKK